MVLLLASVKFINGKVEKQVFEGTDAEVQAKIDELK
jgi:hypothetical protein